MSKTLMLVAALCAVVVAAIGATSAFAGEITGNGSQNGRTPTGGRRRRRPFRTLARQLAMRVLGPGRQPVPGTADNPNPEYDPARARAELGAHRQSLPT